LRSSNVSGIDGILGLSSNTTHPYAFCYDYQTGKESANYGASCLQRSVRL